MLWVNRPDVDGMASHKPGQLPVAAAHGLNTPRSLITTDPDDSVSLTAHLFQEQIPKDHEIRLTSWIQNRVGLPIAAHIAELLAGGLP